MKNQALDFLRIVFVNRYYWPDEPATAQLLTDLAEGLATRGHRVSVIASHDGLATTPEKENHHGVSIIRLRTTRRGRLTIVGKACDYLTFTLAARRALRAELRAGDRLVAMTDPPSLALVAASAARRAGATLVHWIQDIHPEIGLALSDSWLLAALSKPWIRRRDAAWRSAQACVAVSRDMAALAREHGVPPARIHVIPNWTPGGEMLGPVAPEQNALRREWGVADKFVVAYSGNLGRVHALEPAIEAAALLRDERDLVFLFVGDGPRRPALEAAARAGGLDNVRFAPFQPRTRLAENLSAGDVHLVTLRTGCERCVYPSKLYGILAVARPVVYFGPPQCELADAVRASGAGVVVDVARPADLAAALRKLKADPGRREAMARAAARWSGETGGLPAALDAWGKVLAESVL